MGSSAASNTSSQMRTIFTMNELITEVFPEQEARCCKHEASHGGKVKGLIQYRTNRYATTARRSQSTRIAAAPK
jgi:hypothetical protein